MDARIAGLQEKLRGLLHDAAEVAVELDQRTGVIKGVPHYSVIELRAHELGEQLSRTVQQRQMAEIVANQATQGQCPSCGTACELQPWRRPEELTSIDGKVSLQELKGYCPRCRRAFFPSACDVGVGCAGGHSADGQAGVFRRG
jgi:uncharacterized protein with PIN domain